MTDIDSVNEENKETEIKAQDVADFFGTSSDLIKDKAENQIIVTSEYFEGQGEATSARRPVDKCKDMINRRSRSQSLKRKMAEKVINSKEPNPKKPSIKNPVV